MAYAYSTARLILLAAIVVASGASAGYYLYLARAETLPAATERAVIDSRARESLLRLRRLAHVAFRNLQPGPAYGRLAFASLDHRDERMTTMLSCNRIHFTANGGICLAVATHPAGYRAYLIGASLDVTNALEIPGTPSRARMSPDNTRAAYTAFVGADSYLAAGLSTRTRVIDVTSGRELADLEAFDVLRNGTAMRGPDFNFWGVTFMRDASRFFATLGTAGRTHLVEGDLRERTLTVVADDIECPSLSPDGTRLAFKKKFGSGLTARWQPAIFELSTRAVRLLPEPRHIDDQIEWLDDSHVLYALTHSISASVRRADVWRIATDGSSAPTVFIADAESPAIVKP
jgi:hypothetical protein